MGECHRRAPWLWVAVGSALVGAGACTSMLDLEGYNYAGGGGGHGTASGGSSTSTGGGGASGVGGGAPGCSDGSQNGDESDVDCGGSCPPCENGKSCGTPSDCQSGLCSDGTCSACTSSSQCAATEYCSAGSCQPKEANGAPCTEAAECSSDRCPGDDHVCCDQACNDLCLSCLASKTGQPDGNCSDVTVGTDPDGECVGEIGCSGLGSCIGCGFVLTPPGGSCPTVCDSCANKTCYINCVGWNACANDTITCPPGFNCDVDCHGDGACDAATIHCPGLYSCNVDCAQDVACQSTIIQCGAGTCDLSCTNFLTCNGASMTCGVNACSATCAFGASKPSMTCGPACGCAGCNG